MRRRRKKRSCTDTSSSQAKFSSSKTARGEKYRSRSSGSILWCSQQEQMPQQMQRATVLCAGDGRSGRFVCCVETRRNRRSTTRLLCQRRVRAASAAAQQCDDDDAKASSGCEWWRKHSALRTRSFFKPWGKTVLQEVARDASADVQGAGTWTDGDRGGQRRQRRRRLRGTDGTQDGKSGEAWQLESGELRRNCAGGRELAGGGANQKDRDESNATVDVWMHHIVSDEWSVEVIAKRAAAESCEMAHCDEHRWVRQVRCGSLPSGNGKCWRVTAKAKMERSSGGGIICKIACRCEWNKNGSIRRRRPPADE